MRKEKINLGNGDSLLFHGLVNGHSILGAHFVELVDAHEASVGQHHRSGFERETAVLVTGFENVDYQTTNPFWTIV